MKVITIAGNIGKDAVTRTTQNGDKVTGFSVAVEDRSGREKSTEWFDVTIWGARGEKLAQYLTKGSKVVVSGEFSRQENEGRTYLKVKADAVTLMGGGRQDPADAYADAAQPVRRHDKAPASLDDEIPF